MFCAGSGECCSKEQGLNNELGSVPSGVSICYVPQGPEDTSFPGHAPITSMP